jgi:hypothetical protein
MSFKTVMPEMILSEAHPDFETANKGSRLGAKVVEAVGLARANANRAIDDLQKKAEFLIENEKLLAKYKIEVLFGPGRTTNGPNPVRIMCWESGKKFHGGGDESMFFCKDGTVEDGEGCWNPIPGDQVKGGIAFCKHCNRAINSDKLAMQKEGKVTTKNLSIELVRMFRQLGSSADIYCKYNKDDIHYIAMARQKGESTAKRLLGLHIFPLRHIIKETSTGADLGKRFYAFLTS